MKKVVIYILSAVLASSVMQAGDNALPENSAGLLTEYQRNILVQLCEEMADLARSSQDDRMKIMKNANRIVREIYSYQYWELHERQSNTRRQRDVAQLIPPTE